MDPINWNETCDLKEVKCAFGEYLKDSGDCSIWLELEKAFRTKLVLINPKTSRKINYELNELRKALINAFNIGCSPTDCFHRDFDEFAYFISLSFNHSGSTLPSAVVGKISIALFKQRLESILTEQESYENLSQYANELKSLTKLTRINDIVPDKSEGKDVLEPVLGYFRACLLALINMLAHILYHKQKQPQPLSFVNTADTLWELMNQTQGLSEVNKNQAYELLAKCYKESAAIELKSICKFKEYKKAQESSDGASCLPWNPGLWLSSLTKSDPTSILNDILASDVEAIEHFGRAHYRTAMLLFQVNKTQGLNAYLEKFKMTRTLIKDYSIELYAFRKAMEQKWRSNKNYLQFLHALDNKLLSVHQQLNEHTREWLTEATRFVSDEPFILANKWLALLLSEDVKTLQQFEWLEHTCYCAGRTEDNMAHEMQALDHTKNGRYLDHNPAHSYELTDTYTQSDFLQDNYAKAYRNTLQELLKVHPDKLLTMSNETRELLQPIAAFCFSELTKLRINAKALSLIWTRGPWAKQSPDITLPAVESVESCSEEPFEPSVVAKPAHDLSLDSLSLHAAYLLWLETQNSLIKRTRIPRMEHDLWRTDTDDFWICFYTANLQALPGLMKADAEAKKRKKTAEDERDAADQARDAADQECEAIEQEIRDLQDATIELLRDSLSDKLELALIKLGETPTNEQLSNMMKTITDSFSKSKKIPICEVQLLLIEVITANTQFNSLRPFIDTNVNVANEQNGFFYHSANELPRVASESATPAP
jgi:hypothetical protein